MKYKKVNNVKDLLIYLRRKAKPYETVILAEENKNKSMWGIDRKGIIFKHDDIYEAP
jgi:hypothetical protein